LRWKKICSIEKASKAGKAKAKKYPKWSQERRKAFTIKRLERGLTENQE
jgi:hypothetical protein